MSIPTWPISGARERELLDEVLASDRLSGYHPIVARFEQEFRRVPTLPPQAASVHTNYLLLGWVDGDRGAFHRSLTAAGHPWTPFYPHTLYNNPLYKERRTCRVMPCPNSEARVTNAFWIPHRALLGDETSAIRTAAMT
jgi:dTDP-4-amino-4,6-dideoxygalactose transaminase